MSLHAFHRVEVNPYIPSGWGCQIHLNLKISIPMTTVELKQRMVEYVSGPSDLKLNTNKCGCVSFHQLPKAVCTISPSHSIDPLEEKFRVKVSPSVTKWMICCRSGDEMVVKR